MSDSAQKNTLVYLIHGLGGSADSISELAQVVNLALRDAHVVHHTFSHTSVFSNKRAASITAEIIKDIAILDDSNDYDNVVIVGHSIGAVLGRRAIIEAVGLETRWPENGSAHRATKVEPSFVTLPKSRWGRKVSSLVMMASVSNGWCLDDAKSGIQKLYWQTGALFGHAIYGKLKPTIFDFRKGSPFISQTRLRWLEYINFMAQEKIKRPRVIQFLGTVDQVVPPNDLIDFIGSTDDHEFQQIQVPATGHGSITRFTTEPGNPQRTESICKERQRIVAAVLSGQTEKYSDYLVKRIHLDESFNRAPNEKTDHHVFIVHGIRDTGYWASKLAAQIKATALKNGMALTCSTPTYGYFPILPFLLPWYRRQKVEWLMDKYVEAKINYPNAMFHYVGHSNGTYLASRALLDYPATSFRRIMFAGSVVHPTYPWKKLVESGRVDAVYNGVASKDWVVAIFPNGLRYLKSIFDLGGAGHSGFCYDDKNHMFQLEYIEGNHSAAKNEQQWSAISNFIALNELPKPVAEQPDFTQSQPSAMRWLGYFSPLIIFMVAVVLILLAKFLLSSEIRNAVGLGGQLFSIAVYIAVIRFIAIRF